MPITDDRGLGMCCPSLSPTFPSVCGWFVDGKYALRGPYDVTAWMTPSAFVEHSCTWDIFAKGAD